MSAKFRGRYPETPTVLAPATPVDVTIPTGGGTHTSIVVHNGGVNPITALSYAIQPLARAGSFTAAPSGLPLAAGASLTITIIDQPCTAVVVRAESTLGSTANISAVSQG